MSTDSPITSVTESSDSTEDTVRNAIVTVILCLFFLMALGLNVTALVFYAMIKRLQVPPNYLLVSLAVADVMCAVFWIMPAVVTASTWEWLLGEQFCKFQAFMSVMLYALNVTTLLAIALERLMKFATPSRHKEAFTKTITLILVFALWFFSMVFAMMPLIGWGQYAYIAPRFHCVMNFGASYSLLHFFTVTAYGIPLLMGIIFFIIVFIKVVASRKKLTSVGDVILEERSDRPKQSYAERLRLQEERYKNIANKRTKPKLGRKGLATASKNPNTTRDDGYNSQNDETRKEPNITEENIDDIDTEDSDIEDNNPNEFYLDYMDAINERREKERRTREKRRFLLHNRERGMTVTVVIIWAILMALWLPYMVLNYIWVYNNYPHYSNTGMHIAFMVLAMASCAYKPLIYLSNRYMRILVKRELQQRRARRQIHKEQKSEYKREQTGLLTADDGL